MRYVLLAIGVMAFLACAYSLTRHYLSAPSMDKMNEIIVKFSHSGKGKKGLNYFVALQTEAGDIIVPQPFADVPRKEFFDKIVIRRSLVDPIRPLFMEELTSESMLMAEVPNEIRLIIIGTREVRDGLFGKWTYRSFVHDGQETIQIDIDLDGKAMPRSIDEAEISAALTRAIAAFENS